LSDAIKIGGMHIGGFAEAAQAMGIFGLSQVTASGAKAQGLASGGDFKPFGYGLFRFDAFGTSHKLIQKSMQYTRLKQCSKRK
jgi:hypothetical protein